MILPLLLAFVLGGVAGLRSMTAPAVVSLGAQLGWISLAGTPLAFLGSKLATWILVTAMLAELVADKLPRTPNRTDPGPFIGRLLTGGLAGAGLAVGVGASLVGGAVAGGLGAVVGTFGGYQVRMGLVRTLGTPDYVVAIAEDIVAVGGAILLVAMAR